MTTTTLTVPRRAESPGAPVVLALTLALADLAGTLVRRTGRGGGTSLPGRLLLGLAPDALATLATRLPRGCAAISATNGKTTTAAMAAAVLGRDGTRLVHNRTGANMAGGVATTLAGAARRGGREVAGDLGLFEVDELWLPTVAGQLRPRAVLLGNLFRDQLDRAGELDGIAARWAGLATDRSGDTRFVVGADDPTVAGIGRQAAGTVYYGLDDGNLPVEPLQHASDSTTCPRCDTPYAYDPVHLAHLGRWACPGCGTARPALHVAATDIRVQGSRSSDFTLAVTERGAASLPAARGEVRVELPLPGLYNVYNAVGAAALCLTLGAGLEEVAAGLAEVEPAFGRAETVHVAGRQVSLLLVKNPAGANQVLRTLREEPGPLDLLALLNDRTADGRDVSWIWDVDWEVLAPRVRRVTCSGTRAADIALRLKHAGIPADRLHIVDRVGSALARALGPPGSTLHVLPTYTALLELRELLAAAGHTREVWR